mmetsp:Transcript_17256/g.39801  ORF Transcript_17256/g.39801 Transcript_17256/m.39801 type:complete len:196 (+) Transcript_17256:37-624(+)
MLRLNAGGTLLQSLRRQAVRPLSAPLDVARPLVARDLHSHAASPLSARWAGAGSARLWGNGFSLGNREPRTRPGGSFGSHCRGMARYEGEMPVLGERDFVVLSPEVSGAGGMSVPAELGEISELNCEVGMKVEEDQVISVIETCKASVEARCRASGVVKHVLVEEGEEVMELHPLVVVESDKDLDGRSDLVHGGG